MSPQDLSIIICQRGERPRSSRDELSPASRSSRGTGLSASRSDPRRPRKTMASNADLERRRPQRPVQSLPLRAIRAAAERIFEDVYREFTKLRAMCHDHAGFRRRRTCDARNYQREVAISKRTRVSRVGRLGLSLHRCSGRYGGSCIASAAVEVSSATLPTSPGYRRRSSPPRSVSSGNSGGGRVQRCAHDIDSIGIRFEISSKKSRNPARQLALSRSRRCATPPVEQITSCRIST